MSDIDVSRLLRQEFGGRAEFRRRAKSAGIEMKKSTIDRMCDRRSLSGEAVINIITTGRKIGREIDINNYREGVSDDTANDSGSANAVS